jgi:hypothetical protein
MNFPVTYGLTQSGVRSRGRYSHATDDRPEDHPHRHVDEYWQFRASLLGTDPNGAADVADPANVRRYLLSSTQHGWFMGDAPHHGIANRQCQQLTNATHTGVILRALIVALEQWVNDGKPPPDSRVPRISDATLVAPERLAFPSIPGVTFAGLYNGAGERDFGPRVKANSGVVDKPFPSVLSTHRILVPQADRLGNDIAGVRYPLVDAPVATLTGWNTRTPEFGGDDLCDLFGSTVPLRRTKQDAHAAGDPRPALDELYRSHDDYVQKVERAARALEKQRLMLPEDVELTVRGARDSDVLR